ncbi:MAG: hypothetical protein ACRCTI_01380 [Beijerinckiaceae bacterium]
MDMNEVECGAIGRQIEPTGLIAVAVGAHALAHDMRRFSNECDGWVAAEGRALATALQVWAAIAVKLDYRMFEGDAGTMPRRRKGPPPVNSGV